MRIAIATIFCVLSISSFAWAQATQPLQRSNQLRPQRLSVSIEHFTFDLSLDENSELAFSPTSVSSSRFDHLSGDQLEWGQADLSPYYSIPALNITVGVGNNNQIIPDPSSIELIDYRSGTAESHFGTCNWVSILRVDDEIFRYVCRVNYDLPDEPGYDPCWDTILGEYICPMTKQPDLELRIYTQDAPNNSVSAPRLLLRHYFKI